MSMPAEIVGGLEAARESQDHHPAPSGAHEIVAFLGHLAVFL
jgi:hypothetical protein